MDPLISDLLGRYEQGRLSRRDLVAGLSALTAAGCAAGPGGIASAQAPAQIIPSGIDHVSILTSDLQGSADWYTRVFGLVKVSEDTENKILRLGTPLAPEGSSGTVGPVIVSLRQEEPYGVVDHWSFHVPNFDRDAAAEALAAHGLTPETNIDYGFHVRDPNGVVVQMA